MLRFLEFILAVSPGSMNGDFCMRWMWTFWLLRVGRCLMRNSVCRKPTALARFSRDRVTEVGSEEETRLEEAGVGNTVGSGVV